MDDSYTIACEFITETNNAILIKDPASDEEHWIPLSQVISIDRNKNGINIELEMTLWIAKKKGLYK